LVFFVARSLSLSHVPIVRSLVQSISRLDYEQMAVSTVYASPGLYARLLNLFSFDHVLDVRSLTRKIVRLAYNE
ncbi:MAG: hypothetical protein ACI87Q_000610, partial [Pseudohongiellaceae bacterium]